MTTLSPDDDAAIRGLIERMRAGWNAGDGAAFASVFTPDADYVIVNGRHIRGRDGIRAGHEWLFSGVYRGSRVEFEVEQVRGLREGVAVAHTRSHLNYTADGETREGRTRFSLVLLKDDGAWLAAAFQNTTLQGE
jgi:uncharacterized protein (TIGR02246 family)